MVTVPVRGGTAARERMQSMTGIKFSMLRVNAVPSHEAWAGRQHAFCREVYFVRSKLITSLSVETMYVSIPSLSGIPNLD
jgi:hypothetical protein